MPACNRRCCALAVQALRALRSAQTTLEGLPAELLGRVNQSGRWSFKQMLQAAESSPEQARGGYQQGAANGGVPMRRLPVAPAAAQQAHQQQLTAAQKAAMSAVSLLSGGIAAHRTNLSPP